MKILDILPKEAIVPELKARTKREVLEELSEALVGVKNYLKRDELVEVLMERERLGSTGIGEGVAIPHGKLKDLDQLLICFGRSTEGIDFDSMDGKPAHLFFLLVAPENSAGIHLRALAKISRLLRSVSLRQKLFNASSRDEIFEIISQQDQEF